MHTKLTLRMDEVLVDEAKKQAARRGKSVSQMFGEFVAALGDSRASGRLPPATNALLGVIKGHHVSEKDYKKHLMEKKSSVPAFDPPELLSAVEANKAGNQSMDNDKK